MCGVLGVVGKKGESLVVPQELFQAALSELSHRGPDGQGIHCDKDFILGHRRLSIIDLEDGKQPMMDISKRYVISYNGEIYNYKDVRAELEKEGLSFQTNSDTEVLLQAWITWGFSCLDQLRGMFAFAIVDRVEGTCTLVRDRYGIKPLYFSDKLSDYCFSSEIKPLLKLGVSFEPNISSLYSYVFQRIPHHDDTIFKGIHRVPEGGWVRFSKKGLEQGVWYENPKIDGFINGEDAYQLFQERFENAVKTELEADVPVGIYLSGGVDSTLLACELHKIGYKTHSFTVDFQRGYSEASLSEQLAKQYGFDHNTVFLDDKDILNLPKIVESLEEPIGDPIVIAQYSLAAQTKAAGIKTVITGDAADEVFGGYPFLKVGPKINRFVKSFPIPLRRVIAKVISRAPLGLIRRLADLPFDVSADARSRIAYLASIGSRDSEQEIYDNLVALFARNELEEVFHENFKSRLLGSNVSFLAGTENSGSDNIDRFLSLQYRAWLPSNMNHRQDRMCMAHSVENRVPFLDVRLVEAMAQVSSKMKIANGTNKLLLRRRLEENSLGQASQRKKLPFYFPAEFFLENKKVRDLISENTCIKRTEKRGVFSTLFVKETMKAADRGGFLAAKRLFAIVILELWFRRFVDNERF